MAVSRSMPVSSQNAPNTACAQLQPDKNKSLAFCACVIFQNFLRFILSFIISKSSKKRKLFSGLRKKFLYKKCVPKRLVFIILSYFCRVIPPPCEKTIKIVKKMIY